MTLHFQPPAPDHVPPERMVDFDFFAVPPGMADPTEIWHDLVRQGVVLACRVFPQSDMEISPEEPVRRDSFVPAGTQSK